MMRGRSGDGGGGDGGGGGQGVEGAHFALLISLISSQILISLISLTDPLSSMLNKLYSLNHYFTCHLCRIWFSGQVLTFICKHVCM